MGLFLILHNYSHKVQPQRWCIFINRKLLRFICGNNHAWIFHQISIPFMYAIKIIVLNEKLSPHSVVLTEVIDDVIYFKVFCLLDNITLGNWRIQLVELPRINNGSVIEVTTYREYRLSTVEVSFSDELLRLAKRAAEVKTVKVIIATFPLQGWANQN